MLMLAARLGLLAVLGSATSNPYPLLSELWWGWEQECNPSWGLPDAAPVSCAEDFSEPNRIHSTTDSDLNKPVHHFAGSLGEDDFTSRLLASRQ
ncbi:hypothetical protein FOZ60_004844 [Perkinsus olseni]|uniref:Uncharacterized protein n=1 Tax=Perkinsus olseni TaxID=32597 RepID=A0A7J6PGK3_PEROL|nr:hypothetical protein FOZ60_004844 [Perkinsus olseni]